MFEDGLCNLYVAMTRAKRRLELIVPHVDSGAEVKAPRLADFVRAAMPEHELHCSEVPEVPETSDAQGIVWSHPGNAPGIGWATSLATEAGADAESAVTSLGLATSTRSRSLARRSPSAEEGGRLVRAESLFRDKRGARQGTLVHRWLEDLVWIGDFELDEARALDVGAALEPDAGRCREALAALAAALRAPPVRAVLAPASCGAPADATLEVSNEHAFSLILADEAGQDQLWTGSIDRLVLARRGDDIVWAQVLDYKTDRLGEDDLAERARYYRPQLETYGRVVAAQTGLPADAIDLRLVFLDLGRVVEIAGE